MSAIWGHAHQAVSRLAYISGTVDALERIYSHRRDKIGKHIHVFLSEHRICGQYAIEFEPEKIELTAERKLWVIHSDTALL